MTFILSLMLAGLLSTPGYAQLERRQVSAGGPVELTFMAPRTINILTVEPLGAGELHYSIMHTFGEVNGGFRELWGIDQGANVRLSFEYAPTEQVSLMAGRSSVDKVFDMGARLHLLRQSEDGDMPFSLSVSGGMGYNGSDLSFLKDDYGVLDRFHTQIFAHLARKIDDDLSLQVSPGIAFFRRVGPELSLASSTDNVFFGSALSGRYKVAPRTAATFQFMPRVYGGEADVVLGAGIDIETGGHVFQLYVVTGNALNDAYLLAGRNGGLAGGDFRIGFNVNRVFSVGSPEAGRR